jgi:2'-5' RNA ligase
LRLFIASFFDPVVSEAVAKITAMAGDAGGAVKWVDPARCHLTYAFLGEKPGFEPEARAAGEALEGLASFRGSTGGLGAFPSLSAPKVFWLSVADGAPKFREIAARLLRAFPQAGEVESFVPHLTLGRVRGGLPEGFISRLAAAAEANKVLSKVSSVDLVRSQPGQAGPVYNVVFSKPLL